MNRETLKNALEELECATHNKSGYGVKEILDKANITINRKNEKQARAKLRSMISKILFPQFAAAGNEDIVYCPHGKGSGLYRLSKYREN